MKNFINNLNLAVGLLAGICTIILFCRDLFFQKTNASTNTGSSISYKKDTFNASLSNATNKKLPNINQPKPLIERQQSPINTNTQTHRRTNKQDSTVQGTKAVADSTHKVFQQNPSSKSSSSPSNEKADFFVTLIKTPLVFYALLFGLIGCFFVGIFELLQNVFTNFKQGFETTSDIWNWAWNDVTLAWYWNNGVGWHLAISIIIWFAIVTWSNKEK